MSRSTHRHASGLLLLLSWTAVGPSCSGLRDPEMHVVSASVVQTTDEALALRFTLSLENPNDEPLELLIFDYELEVDGEKVHEGRRSAQATLASRASREILIPAVVPYDIAGWSNDSFPRQARYEISGTLRYTTPGEIARVLYETGVRKPCAGFKGEGEFQIDAATTRNSLP